MNALVAVGLAAAYAAIDALWACYTIAVSERRALRAASTGSAIYLASAVGILAYVHDWRYVFPVAAGEWVGTFLTVRLRRG